MDKSSKVLLNHLIQQGGCEKMFFFNELDVLSSQLNLPTEDVRANIRYLHDNGYIDYQKTKTGHTLTFSLSHKGLKYKDFKIEAIKDFLLKSVVVPIFVSIITALVTTGITLMLKDFL